MGGASDRIFYGSAETSTERLFKITKKNEILVE